MGFGGGFCFKGFCWWWLGGDGWMVLGGWWNLHLCKFLYFAVIDAITLTLVKGSNEGCFGRNFIY